VQKIGKHRLGFAMHGLFSQLVNACVHLCLLCSKVFVTRLKLTTSCLQHSQNASKRPVGRMPIDKLTASLRLSSQQNASKHVVGMKLHVYLVQSLQHDTRVV